MEPISFPRDDGTARLHLTEVDWRALVGSAAEARGAPPRLPEWATPLPIHDDTRRTSPPVFDADVVEAIALGSSALVEVEVASSRGEAGAFRVLWSDGVHGTAITRRVVIDVGETRLVGGIEVGRFTIGGLLDETVQALPTAEPTRTVGHAALDDTTAIALAQAIRSNDHATIDALCAQANLPVPPAVLVAAVSGLAGTATITVRHAAGTDVAVMSLLLTDAGWVELRRERDGIVVHQPRTVEEIRHVLLGELARRLLAGAGR